MSELQPDNRVGQVQVIPFRKTREELEVLVLQRNEAKGGFWQPVTGGIDPGETVEEAARREVNEELGVDEQQFVEFVDDDYKFKFTDMHRGVEKTFTENVVAAVLKEDAEIELSDEHVDSRWTTLIGALALLKYDSNKASLQHYWDIVREKYDEPHA